MKNELNYIKNKPTGKDCFDGKSHEKISESIANHIDNEVTSMKVIGLEGEWGSGKSNIIEILKQQLKDTHYIYIYDSWGHQEDSQRRAFLEEMTEELIENKLLTDKTEFKNIDNKILKISWQEKIKYLLARKKETSKKTIPKLSLGLIVISLLIVLTPILALISNLLGENTKDILIIKILFSSSLLILSIVVFILYSIYKKIRYKEWANLSSLFYLYKGKELENTTFEILSDLEPSVKEFKDWIKSISEGLIDKKLIIVYDNMDRLPPDKVKGIWSSIHTFFAEEEYEKIHIIIPFDRKHLQKAFDTDDETTQTNEFINKTFSLIYRVTPPILTDWKKFFHTKFEEAFQNSENEELPLVLSIFDRLKERFTPRDMIVFINELVSYKKIWKDDIPLRYIAIFTLQKEIILQNPHKNILDNNYLKTTNELFFNDNKLQDYISSLTFNVPVEKASQVLLIRDLELTLRDEKNSLDINELANNINFIDLLEEVIKTSELVLDKTIQVLSTLDKEKLQGDNTDKKLENIWNILVTKQSSTHDIEELSFNENYEYLLLNSSNHSNNTLINYLLEQFYLFENINGKDYFESFNALDIFIEENNIEFDLQNKIKSRKVNSDVFLHYLEVADKDYKKYNLTTNFEELDTFITKKIPDDIENIHLINLSNILKECNFDNTKEKIKEMISSNLLIENNFAQILTIYKLISKDKPLDEIIAIPNLYKLLEQVKEGSYGFYDLVAMRIKYNNQYNANTCGIQPHIWKDKLLDILNSNDEKIIKKVAKLIEYYICYGDLLLLATKWQKTILKEVCKDLISNRYGTKSMHIKDSLTNFEKIKSTLEVDEKDLLKSLNSWSEFAKKDITLENIQEIITDYNFYNYSISISLDLTKHINKIIKEFINEQEQDFLITEWNNNNSYVWNSLYIFMQNDTIKKIPKNVFDAMKDILIKISKTEIGLPNDDSRWSFFIDKIDKKKITPTIKDIRDYFIRENNIDCNMFKFFEPLFREVASLNHKSEDVTRTILTKIISNENCLEILIEHQTFYSEIIDKAGDDAENLKDIILDKLKKEDENSELEEFAKKINLHTEEKIT